MYKCYSCGKQFRGGARIDNVSLWQQYVAGKQTYSQLAATYGCSIKTIQRRLDKIKVTVPQQTGKEVVVLMDTTYFGRTFGVMLFKDAYSGRNLYKQYVKKKFFKIFLPTLPIGSGHVCKCKGLFEN